MRQGEPILDIQASYLWPYIQNAPETDLRNALVGHLEAVVHAFSLWPEAKSNHAYGPEKWTVRQLMGHMVDAHHVFAFRAFSIARGESQELLPFDEDRYAVFWKNHSASLASITEMYRITGQLTLAQFDKMTAEHLNRPGIANRLRLTPKDLFRAMMGHERHHMLVLQTRYA
jgi:uncharacterized damage-inducible protein DinB